MHTHILTQGDNECKYIYKLLFILLFYKFMIIYIY